MKRSKMLEIMVDTYCRANAGHESLADSEAEAILNAIEKAGMVPPVRIEKSVMPGVPDFTVNTWEPE